MTKLRATRAQVIAAAVIAALAIVVGVVGLYGLNARGSESGTQVLENMRLQAILNTAGSGAVDAYVAAAKSEASTKARESGGGMSAVREAAAKAEEEARAKAEELGIGAVDLTEIDTEPMSAALDVLLAAQRAYFAEEASAQAAYAAQAAQSAPADDTAAAADDTAEDDLTMEEETVDLSGFVATEAMNRLSAEVDDAYGALCGQIKAVFPALTDDVLATLKPTITGIVAVQNDRFELQYDRALAASGMNPGLNGVILREAYTMAVSAFGLLILAAAVLFYIPLVAKMGVPRLIIGLFFILLCLLAMILGLSLPSQLSNTLVRLGMNGVLVLAMLPGIQCGISLNLGLPIGIIGGLIGGLLCIEFGMSGFTGLFFAIAVGLVIAAATGWLYGLLLNRLKGSEMSVTTYVGFSVVSLMCIAWLVLPFKSPIMKWPLGNGLRTTIGLQTSYRHVLNDFLSFEILRRDDPDGAFAVLCGLLSGGVAVHALQDGHRDERRGREPALRRRDRHQRGSHAHHRHDALHDAGGCGHHRLRPELRLHAALSGAAPDGLPRRFRHPHRRCDDVPREDRQRGHRHVPVSGRADAGHAGGQRARSAEHHLRNAAHPDFQRHYSLCAHQVGRCEPWIRIDCATLRATTS